VWGKVIEAAEEAYDRTSSCTFTSFIAYEYTAMAATAAAAAICCPAGTSSGPGSRRATAPASSIRT
jgi:hypothetical protein